jgi:hypothetical protein
MVMNLRLIPSATTFVIPCASSVTIKFQVACQRSWRLLYLFIFLPPIFLPWLPNAGTRRRIGKKRRGKKIEDILEYPHLRLSVSSLRLSALARALVDIAQDRDNLLSFGERFRLKSYYFPLKNRMDPICYPRFPARGPSITVVT